MRKVKNNPNLKERILFLKSKIKSTPISVKELLNIFSGKSLELTLVFLTLPFCQPIQIPGLSTPFGFTIAIIGLRMLFGKDLWLPKSLLLKKIQAKTLTNITTNALILLEKLKRWIHPRCFWMCHSSYIQVFNGITIFILGLCLALPLPIPFSNLTAAWSIFLITIGTLENDGIFVLTGYMLSIATITIFSLLILFTKHTI